MSFVDAKARANFIDVDLCGPSFGDSDYTRADAALHAYRFSRNKRHRIQGVTGETTGRVQNLSRLWVPAVLCFREPLSRNKVFPAQ